MTIEVDDLVALATICAQLVREGVTFDAVPSSRRAGGYTISLTGGY